MPGTLRISTLSSILAVIALASVAHAVPMHMDVTVKARPAAKGRPCGATITCKVRSDNPGFSQVRVGLAPLDIVRQIDNSSAGRLKAFDMSHGVIKVQSERSGLAMYDVADVTIEVDYDGATFAPGKRFQVVSGWPSYSNASSVHVFGAATTFGPENAITLP